MALAGWLLMPGCRLYFEQDDSAGGGRNGGDGWPDAGVRRPDGGTCSAMDASWLRNPWTGRCEAFFNPGDPCWNGTPLPPWGSCDGCSRHDDDEAACLDDPQCRAAYVESAGRGYIGCWSLGLVTILDPSGCAGLDAELCAGMADCVAVYESLACLPDDLDATFCGHGSFVTCEDEPRRCVDIDQCPNGWWCSDDGLCKGGTGSCYGEVTCPHSPPGCAPNSTPGVANGCWTGACIFNDSCDLSPLCDQIEREEVCLDQAQCAPVYRGEGCSCDDGLCACESWVFDRCTYE